MKIDPRFLKGTAEQRAALAAREGAKEAEEARRLKWENDARPSMTKRILAWTGDVATGAMQLVFVVIALVFGVGQCVGDTRDMLACVGLSGEAGKQELQVRSPDPANPNDVRAIGSLLEMANIGGLSVKDLRVAIVEADIVNAATLGKSTFILFDGLSQASKERLDAIMAHEIAHATLEHSENAVDRASTIAAIARVAGVVVGAESAAQREVSSWAVGALLPAYSRAQELEADAEAVRILRRAGYAMPGKVMGNALAWLRKIAGESGGGFFDSHPAISERIQRLEQGTVRR